MQPHDVALAGRAGPDVKLVADPPNDRLSVFRRRRKSCGHPIVRSRRAGVPTGPDEAAAAPEGKAEPKIILGLWIVSIGARRGIVEQVHNHLAATIGDVVDEHTAGSAWIGRPQNEEIGLVLDQTARVHRSLVEIGNDAVFQYLRIEFSLCRPADPQIGAGPADSPPFGEWLHCAHLDLNARHRPNPFEKPGVSCLSNDPAAPPSTPSGIAATARGHSLAGTR